MSDRGHKNLTSRQVLLPFLMMLLLTSGVSLLCGCQRHKDQEADSAESMESLNLRDPLPGELVQQTLMEDSVRNVRRERVKKEMARVITDYKKRFHQEHFTGYFLTDLDKDGLPELWVKVGTYRDNSKLELYYPMQDGSLLKSDTFAEPGQYYIGDDYIIQVVGSGPGFINVNKITLHKGVMDVEYIKGIDLYKDPDARIPTFAEREIRDTSLTNLTTLYKALM